MGHHASRLKLHSLHIDQVRIPLIPNNAIRAIQRLYPQLESHINLAEAHSIPQLGVHPPLFVPAKLLISTLIQIIHLKIIPPIKHPLDLPCRYGILLEELEALGRQLVHNTHMRDAVGDRPLLRHDALHLLHILALEKLALVGLDGMSIEVVDGKMAVLVDTLQQVLLDSQCSLDKLVIQLGSTVRSRLGAGVARKGLVASSTVDSTVLAL